MSVKSSFVKISGKKLAISHPEKIWTFEKRPGGWIIAQCGAERRRLFFHIASGYTASGYETPEKISVSIEGQLFTGEWLQKERASRKSGVSSNRGSRGDEGDLVAQFPGRVRKVLAQVDSAIKEGETLLMIEAMKMEFAIRAPFSGKVKKILVQEGQQLSPGDLFVELVAESEGD